MQPEQPNQQQDQLSDAPPPPPAGQPTGPVLTPQQDETPPDQPLQQSTGWTFVPEQTSAAPIPDETDTTQDVSWTASEFVAHDKSPVWYLVLASGTVAVVALTYFLTKDVITTVMLGLIGLTFGIVAGRPPRTMNYHMTRDGVYIQDKFTPFLEFKSFSVVDEGAVSMVLLAPLKRFMPLTYIYFPPEQEDAIMAILTLHLPYEERHSDPIDNMMRRLRF